MKPKVPDPRKNASLPLRAIRGLWLVTELTLALIGFGLLFVAHRGGVPAPKRAEWLQRSARRLARALGLTIESVGPIPKRGLLVANHLGYLDIIAIGSLTPVRFISKSEVRSWPVFGLLAASGGTIFLDRTRRSDTARANSQLLDALRSDELVVLFPEGTSSDGTSILPFRSSLLEPVAHTQAPVTTAYLSYDLPGNGGSVGREVCYWGEMTLFPHLVNLLGKRRISAQIVFRPAPPLPGCRKEIARALHAEVSRSKQEALRPAETPQSPVAAG